MDFFSIFIFYLRKFDIFHFVSKAFGLLSLDRSILSSLDQTFKLTFEFCTFSSIQCTSLQWNICIWIRLTLSFHITSGLFGFKFAAKFLDIFLTVGIQRSMDTSSATFVAHFRHFATCHASASFTLPHIDQTCKIIDCVIVGIRVVIENIALVFFLGRIFFIITAVFN